LGAVGGGGGASRWDSEAGKEALALEGGLFVGGFAAGAEVERTTGGGVRAGGAAALVVPEDRVAFLDLPGSRSK